VALRVVGRHPDHVQDDAAKDLDAWDFLPDQIGDRRGRPQRFLSTQFRVAQTKYYAVNEDLGVVHPYSDRNTFTGSIRTARITGGSAANNAAARIANAGSVSEPRSVAFTWYNSDSM
jgi:hypothetical protein